jgi:hypothetical protein
VNAAATIVHKTQEPIRRLLRAASVSLEGAHSDAT